MVFDDTCRGKYNQKYLFLSQNSKKVNKILA